MKSRTVWSIALALSGVTVSLPAAAFERFITAEGDELRDGSQPFRFISFNIPNLHLVEDNLPFAETNPWRLPDRFEIADALEAVRQQGGLVVRPYVLSVVRTNDTPGAPRHVLGPGQFNEVAFRTLDLVLQVAGEKGIRVILPLVDNWSWWGGIAEYAGFRGKPKEAFWTDPQIIADFQETIRFVVLRTNTLTGVPYRQDPAILAWETGNELESPASWTRTIAAYIKRLDPQHLVIDGFHSTVLREESLAIPEVDVVTTHHYPGGQKSYAELARENMAKARGRKPYFVGEFGFVETAAVQSLLDAVVESGVSGALVWSLRFRSRDGGFYWHSEPAGGNKYKAYHWPGFASGEAYDEIGLLTLLQKKAFEIRGLPLPAPQLPATPKLLPTRDATALTWQGSAGATSYVVERSSEPRGPFQVVADAVDETAVQHRPLFADLHAPPGRWFYRVRARNAAGLSPASAVEGPIEVTGSALVDELVDLSNTYAAQGKLELRTRDCRQTKEDAHRLEGQEGSWVVYRLPETIRRARWFAFFPKAIDGFTASVSADGQAYETVDVRPRAITSGAGDYGYWNPALFECRALPAGSRFLKIEFRGTAQIGRVEIACGG